MFKYSYKNKNGRQKHVFVYMLCFAVIFLNIFSVIGGLFAIDNANNTQVLAADLWSSYTYPATKDASGYYIINTPEKLSWFFNRTTDTKAKLVCDLDMSAHFWGITKSKAVELDGMGHVITGLKNNTELVWGLLTQTMGNTNTFKNLAISVQVNCESNSANCYIGGFVGRSSNNSQITINNCSMYGSIFVNTKSYSSSTNHYIGGFVGYAEKIDLNNCFNYAPVADSLQGLSTQPIFYIGGLVGYASYSSKFELCGNYGNITSKAKYIGGIAAYAVRLSLNTARCFNSGNINNTLNITREEKEEQIEIMPGFPMYKTITTVYYNTTIAYTGGLIGYVKSFKDNDATVTYIYNTGDVKNTFLGYSLNTCNASTENGNEVIFNRNYFSGGLIGSANANKVNFDLVYTSGQIDGNGIMDYTIDSAIYRSNYKEFYGYNPYNSSDTGTYTISVDGNLAPSVDKNSYCDWSFIGDATKCVLSEDTNRCRAVKPDITNIKLKLVEKDYDFNMSVYVYRGGLKEQIDYNYSLSNIVGGLIPNYLSHDFNFTKKKGKGYFSLGGSENMSGILDRADFYSYVKGKYGEQQISRVDCIGVSLVIEQTSLTDLSAFKSSAKVMWEAVSKYDPIYWCDIVAFNFTMPTSGQQIFDKLSATSGRKYWLKENLWFGGLTGGTYYRTDDNINDGLPIFKEMYWELV